VAVNQWIPILCFPLWLSRVVTQIFDEWISEY